MSKEQKYNPKWKDATRNQRTKEREAAILGMCQKFGYPNKSALLTALIKGDAIVVKVKEKHEETPNHDQ